MNDQGRKNGRDGRALNFLGGPLLGGLVGAGIALLNAPQSGEETREQIERTALEARGKAKQAVDDTRRQIKEAGDDASQRAADAAAQAQATAEEAERRLAKAAEEAKQAAQNLTERWLDIARGRRWQGASPLQSGSPSGDSKCHIEIRE